MGAPPHAPGDFLAKRKSPKIRQEPPGLEFGELLTSGTRGRTPLDSPALCPSGIVRGNLNHQASSGGTPPAMPRIDSRECFSDGTEGTNKTDLPTNSKWQIGLLLCLKPYRGGAARRRGSEASPSGEYPEGISPLGDSLVTFSSGRKSPGVGGAERPPHGEECRGWGVSPSSRGGARSDDLLPRGRAPRKRKPCQRLNLTLNKPAPQYRGVAVNDAGLPRCGRALRRIKDHLRPPVVQQGDRRGGVRRAGTHLY